MRMSPLKRHTKYIRSTFEVHYTTLCAYIDHQSTRLTLSVCAGRDNSPKAEESPSLLVRRTDRRSVRSEEYNICGARVFFRQHPSDAETPRPTNGPPAVHVWQHVTVSHI